MHTFRGRAHTTCRPAWLFHTCRLHEELLRAQGVLPSSNPALGVNRFREETAPVPQYLRAVGAPLPRAAGTGVHKTVQRDIEQLLAGTNICVGGGVVLHVL
jgi:hypothetical protein